jgi:hypothetical protein
METKVIRIEIKFTRTMLAILFGSILLLGGLIIVGAALAQNPDPETGFAPLPPGAEDAVSEGKATALGTLAISSIVSPSISYQGKLVGNSRNPLSGDYDMLFQLWDAQTGGNPVGDVITKTNVAVEDGLFDVKLNVNPDDFNGQGLWLEVTVGGETLTPTQQILPSPYALSLRPGAIISDTGSYVELNKYQPMDPYSAKFGVYAQTDGGGDFQYGLWGRGGTAGVYGYSTGGCGVYAAAGASGTALCVAGDAIQMRDSNGLVKAAVYANCGPSSSIYRSFNNVNSTEITIASGTSNGECTIDFGFDISDRFWVAMGEYDAPRIVNCELNSNHNKLDCYRFDDSGAGISGHIMVLVY